MASGTARAGLRPARSTSAGASGEDQPGEQRGAEAVKGRQAVGEAEGARATEAAACAAESRAALAGDADVEQVRLGRVKLHAEQEGHRDRDQ